MIKLNGNVIEQGRFPDGTLSLKEINEDLLSDNFANWIDWLYDGDEEMFTIMSLVDLIRRNSQGRIYLKMPYLPNARMDRIKTDTENFALKVFANWINGLGFDRIFVENVHSNVSNALVNNIVDSLPDDDIKVVVNDYDFDVVFFPDEGACKRYKDMEVIKELGLPIAFGIKNRDWKTGEILGLDVVGADVKDKKVLIIDDICSKGFTFYYSGQKLRELGASDVRLYVTHCEDNIKNGEILRTDVISKVYTTDSICHIETEKIDFIRIFRKWIFRK
jgi:ribose-phosphate pyrophosphokinase